ncbi:hypothetical protein [Paenibacillus hexagrammi]|uniref:Nucleoside 2-deoxyribosyltransferase n=1 Tax=Paenibacillus hexagrammi TaxID=2908839 RepID=A0ABY3SI07_9BACL|nr:hypothetical protein [Paenibacillus sp. YPD9-1]UJF33408.1 hypothetical protein L0M14_28530 [Paenibacillus sp. YPD9-1]
MEKQVQTVISGSYRKHFGQMLEVKSFLEQEGIKVLAPVSQGVVNPGEEFIILNEDPIQDPRTLQDSIFAKMRVSSFLVVANIDNYIGKAAVLEMGYAVSLGLQILSIEPVQDPNLAGYCRLFEDVFPAWKAFKVKESGEALCAEVS